MSQVGSVSEKKTEASYFEWKIPDYFSQATGPNSYINSPTFTFSGSSWKLTVHPQGVHGDGWISVYLNKECADTVIKTVVFSIGLKKADGTLEETETLCHAFQKNDASSGWSSVWSRDDLFDRKSELAPSDTVTFTCHVENYVPKSVKIVSKPTRLMELETLSTDFKDLFIGKSNCDFTLKVKDEAFQVHKAVLTARSPVFAAMFEHEMSEKETGVANVEDCDPDSFGDFLHYLYTGRIEGVSFRNAYHLYVTGEKYQVKKLKSFCVSYMRQNLSVENVCDVVILAELSDDAGLLSSGQTFFNRHFGTICSTAGWKKLLKNNYRLAFRLLEEMASKKPKQ